MIASLPREERIGLGVAAALHALLVAALLAQPDTRADLPAPERMTVSLVGEVGLSATAPEPVAESRAAEAPTIAEVSAPLAEPAPAAQPVTPRLERPAAPSAARAAPSQPRGQPSRAPAKPATRAGGAPRVGENFLAGLGDSTRTTETRAPAAVLGASARASLLQGIVREVKPHWQPPAGADVDRLVSKVRFRLNRDGSLAGRPTLVSQRGETDSNRAQAGRHGEQAIRAVQLAAPFDLPAEHYGAWKTVTLDFDWKLSQ
ncbi:energy transducer TonB [Qipengyuania sediminis]|uniref:energy transducer TonB n=1 Tax=Qipengyuania sediminis TaxID=1532023 RepID=UPI00105A4EC5|nr:energy transducer TonB [Qipengyuania sediminis]